ncbi:MAG TPA: hypothetical protein PLY40_04175 [Bacillota bacterium]|nr:hypothetical protein [Bacillota bacterium]
MAIDIDLLKKVITEIKQDLGEGFIATDIWSSTDNKSLIFNYAGSHMYTWGMTPLPALSRTKQAPKSPGPFSGQPKTIDLLNEVTRKLDRTLVTAGFPGLGRYYLINLENNLLALVLCAGPLQQYLLVDPSRTTMGIVMSVVLPKLMELLRR